MRRVESQSQSRIGAKWQKKNGMCLSRAENISTKCCRFAVRVVLFCSTVDRSLLRIMCFMLKYFMSSEYFYFDLSRTFCSRICLTFALLVFLFFYKLFLAFFLQLIFLFLHIVWTRECLHAQVYVCVSLRLLVFYSILEALFDFVFAVLIVFVVSSLQRWISSPVSNSIKMCCWSKSTKLLVLHRDMNNFVCWF